MPCSRPLESWVCVSFEKPSVWLHSYHVPFHTCSRQGKLICDLHDQAIFKRAPDPVVLGSPDENCCLGVPKATLLEKRPVLTLRLVESVTPHGYACDRASAEAAPNSTHHAPSGRQVARKSCNMRKPAERPPQHKPKP